MAETFHRAKFLLAGANGGSGLSDTKEHVEVEPEIDNNEEGGVNGEATGNVCLLLVKFFFIFSQIILMLHGLLEYRCCME